MGGRAGRSRAQDGALNEAPSRSEADDPLGPTEGRLLGEPRQSLEAEVSHEGMHAGKGPGGRRAGGMISTVRRRPR